MLRRMYFKSTFIKDIVDKIFTLYKNMGYVGIFVSEEQVKALQVAPLPGAANRQEFKSPLPPQGPVGLLLQWAHFFSGAIDISTYMLHSSLRILIPFFDVPFQHFKSSIIDLGFKAVHYTVSNTRT
eukprot:4851048-Karenia_brevis.AAC.1